MPTQPSLSTTHANSTSRRNWRYHCLALGLFCMLGATAVAQTCTSNPSCQPNFKFDSYEKGVKTVINDCTTNSSASPCAWADAVQAASPGDVKTYFLGCKLANTGPIALCYYSGVPGAEFYTPSCTLSQDKKTAECSCYEISADSPGAQTNPYSFVLMTSILNKDAYEATSSSSACGADGSLCLNLSDTNSGLKEAPVCDDIRNKTLFAGADLISDFSQIPIPLIAAAGYPPPGEDGSFSQTCGTPPDNPNIYAACMTAPCKRTGKIDEATGFPIAKCTCPTYTGPNQVGNPQIKSSSCSPTPHVWSSAYTDIAK